MKLTPSIKDSDKLKSFVPENSHSFANPPP